MVAGPDRRHLGTDRLDHAGALMAEHNRPVEWKPPDPIHDMQIAVAHPGRNRAHQHLTAPRPVEVDRLDGQRFVHFAKHGGCGFHAFLPHTALSG